MFNIPKFIRHKIAEYRKSGERFEIDKAQIERQRLMLSANSVFLAEDFLAAAVQPLLKRDDNFKRLYGDDAQIIENWFWAYGPSLTLYCVPFSELTQQTQQDVEAELYIQAQEIVQSRRESEGQAVPLYYHADQMSDVKEFKDRYVEDIKGLMVLPAFCVSELGELLTATNFLKYEDRTIRKGKGALISDFWETMNALDDYSHLFNNTGGGDGDKRKKGENNLKEVLGGLKPALP